MIELQCKCGQKFRLNDGLAGMQGNCPKCGALMLIPGPRTAGEELAAIADELDGDAPDDHPDENLAELIDTAEDQGYWPAEARDNRRASDYLHDLDGTEAPKYSSNPTPRCPRCKSTSITAEKKGFSSGKAVLGAALVGPVGLLAGTHGSGDIVITCLNCGHQWRPGSHRVW